jgi:methylenetetrahydrofolate--tRNA-(uracil-5-)-methyltransferase
LLRHLGEADPDHFQPMNVNWGLFPALEQSPRKRLERNQALAARALADLAPWIAQTGPAS